MLTIPSNTRISLCTSPVDMRKSFNGLIGIVRNELDADPLAGHLFVFLNKSNTLVKILYWDGDGFAIWFKRLESGTFRFPPRCDPICGLQTRRKLEFETFRRRDNDFPDMRLYNGCSSSNCLKYVSNTF